MNNPFHDLRNEFDRLLVDLPPILVEQTEVAGKDILASTEDRLVRQGKDANGAAFEQYTPAYLNRKQKAGRDVGHVNFQLSGQMLASTDSGLVNIVPTEKSFSGTTATVVFDGRDQETRKKLEGNDNHRPGFMNPSQKEVDDASEDAGIRMERIIQKRFERFA